MHSDTLIDSKDLLAAGFGRKSLPLFVFILLISVVLVSTVVSESRADEVSATVSVGTAPFEIAVHAASSTALVTNSSSSTVSRIRTTDMTVTTTISVGSSPRGIAIDQAGQYAYVTAFGSNKIWRINLSTNIATSWATVEGRPYDIVIDPTGTYLYVSNDGSSSVSRVATADASVVNISVGGYPRSIAITADGSKVIVVRDGGADVIVIIDTATRVISTYSVDSFPTTVVTGSDSDFAYVGNTRSIMKVNVSTGAIVSSFSVDGTDGLMIDPSGRYIYGTENFFYETVGVDRHYFIRKYSLVQGKYLERVRTGSGPRGIAFDSASNKLLVANARDTTVSVLTFQSKYDQTINFDPGNSTYLTVSGKADKFTLSGTATSGLSLDFVSTTLDICKVVDSALVRISVGSCIIRASQEGDLLWNSATSIDKTIAILADPSPPADKEPEKNAPANSGPTASSSTTTVAPRTASSTTTTIAQISSTSIPQSVNLTTPTVNMPTVNTPTVVTPTVAAPKVTTSKSATAKSIASYAKLTVLSTSKVTLKVVSGYAKICRVSGTSLKGLKAGTCKVAVTVKPKKGASKSKTVSLKVTK
jgi:YVTN family beta-propeller protein